MLLARQEAFGHDLAEIVLEEVDKDLIHEDLRTLTRRLFPQAD